jgi:hypothetical protein
MLTTATPFLTETPPTWPIGTPAIVTAWPWPEVTAAASLKSALTS